MGGWELEQEVFRCLITNGLFPIFMSTWMEKRERALGLSR